MPSPCSGRCAIPDDVHAALAAYQGSRTERAADLVLRARKRCDLMHAKDPQTTEQWYADLRNEDGSNVIRGIVGNILGGPLTPAPQPLTRGSISETGRSDDVPLRLSFAGHPE